ncbi:MAG: hypothetical protein AB1426_02990 [Bacillota bacterium]
MRHTQGGQAALMVVMVLSVLGLLGMATMVVTTYAKQAATGELNLAQARYAAEAGIERAVAKLKVDPLWLYPGSTNKVVYADEIEGDSAGGFVQEVTLAWSQVGETGVGVKITSTGVCRNARKTVSAEVNIAYDPFICGKGITNEGGVHVAGGDDGQLIIGSDHSIIGEKDRPTNLIFGGDPGGKSTVLIDAYGTPGEFKVLDVNLSLLGISLLGSGKTEPDAVVYGNVYTSGDVRARSYTSDSKTGNNGASGSGYYLGDISGLANITALLPGVNLGLSLLNVVNGILGLGLNLPILGTSLGATLLGHTGGSDGLAVKGDVWANGDIEASSVDENRGLLDIFIGSSTNASTAAAIDGTLHERQNLQIPDFPAGIDPTDSKKVEEFKTYYKKLAESYETDGTQHYFSSGKRFDGDDLAKMNGVYFVDGKAVINTAGISGMYNGRVTIVADSIEFKNNSALENAGAGNAVLGLISLRDTVLKGANAVEGVVLCGDTLVVKGGSTTVDGAVATWGLGIGKNEQGGRRRSGNCRQCVVNNMDVSLLYNKELFCRYPPGMPYDVKVNGWKLVK